MVVKNSEDLVPMGAVEAARKLLREEGVETYLEVSEVGLDRREEKEWAQTGTTQEEDDVKAKVCGKLEMLAQAGNKPDLVLDLTTRDACIQHKREYILLQPI